MLNPATTEFIDTLRDRLPEAAFREAGPEHLQEPRGRYTGTGLLLAPGSTEEVATILRACHEARVGVVPHGGGTGLVGGQVMQEGATPVILSLARMDRIRDVYPSENVLVAEGGAILANIQSAAREAGRMFPLSLASEGSARIGGLLATNAGGLNVLRYGNARAQCLGLEVVTAQGEVWHGLTRLYKDNTGYDLRDLMIGAEGTLGIITAAALRMAPVPAASGTALFQVASPRAALDLLALARDRVGDNVTAFELIHRQGPEFLAETGLEPRVPLDPLPDWMVLVELGLPEGLSPEDSLTAIFEAAVEAGLSEDGVIASSESQAAALWAVRETIPEANRRIGSISSHDISVPLSSVPDFIAEGGPALRALGDVRINCFGHLGDGNLHYNVFPPKGRSREDYEHIRAKVKELVHDLAHGFGGSVSAEHGIGRLKVGDLERYGDPAKLSMMRAIKAALDPHGILNPGAVLRG
ncbi:FAD-binding oxidoreductase [Limimaricola pyoseonensis]|uniref:FAD/FMN-containing dehydrogenase n=1 Tax=Limimaricola pyoseonensis TaxID=521013 RepID=A0A1G7DCP8_9RHOB|nr:FAD-binding oxidoreductase [Limimaricola pyoseonensis]SDE49418.1 FAD/FMN-containing dehydrogenase [Limimaricola pyoseonensis]